MWLNRVLAIYFHDIFVSPPHVLDQTQQSDRRYEIIKFSLQVESSRKRHPLFSKCKAQVCLLGEGKSLVCLGPFKRPLRSPCSAIFRSFSKRFEVFLGLFGHVLKPRIPSGWWWTAISTQPSVTLHHTYWSFENRMGFVDCLWSPFESQQTSVDARNAMRPAFQELREAVKNSQADAED